jgi:hypothetical protein
MRYDCDDPAFVGDFVEFSDAWSRAQVRAAWAAWAKIPNSTIGVTDEETVAAEEAHLATLRPKILALHLSCVDADPITDPDDVTPERTDQLDRRLYGWWVNVWLAHLRELADLGNALGRTLYVISAPVATEVTALPNLNHS